MVNSLILLDCSKDLRGSFIIVVNFKESRLLSSLYYSNAVFCELSYLPALVFPLVKTLENETALFETAVTLISKKPLIAVELKLTHNVVNLCNKWFEYLPYPPLQVLKSIELILSTYDSKLHKHFIQKGIPPELYIWSLLNTFFSGKFISLCV